jgi:hypothetical protein
VNESGEEQSALHSPGGVDEGIYCAFCHYNLTGNFTGRCPECGSMFEREILLQDARDAARHVIPWDSPNEIPLLKRFWDTLQLTWFNPREFAMAFGFVRRRSRANSFVLVCALLMLIIVLLTVGTEVGIFLIRFWNHPGAGGVIEYSLREWAGVVFALVAYLCFVTVMASSLLAITLRHRDGSKRFWPWWTILRYAVGHFLLVFPLPFVAAGLGLLSDFDFTLANVLVGYLLLFGATLLWILTLGHVVRWRIGKASRRVVVLVAVLAVLALPTAALFANTVVEFTSTVAYRCRNGLFW